MDPRGGYKGQTNPPNSFGGDKPKKPVCKFFLSDKGCFRGDQCNMYHPKNKFKHGGPGFQAPN